ncbi:MaoC family dehydratase [Nitrospirillum bahiense]|uniref:Acyl dehydratase n=1 Tax=Nitrospirillum amazonense TaxID=28077 RepID=A0A560FVS4_9PROT|nr:MaoC family dehydratase [Nitrospirillum amazonense]TWB25689.1 acyl dehydratase [Nitrospirillum amazonense]
MAITVDTPHDLLNQVGQDLGTTEWLVVDQDRIDGFAQVTGDHQWIHVDPVRAKEGPFGTTIAHGYLTLSLVNLFLPQLLRIQSFASGVNVGLDRVRFIAPVRVGSRLRGQGQILAMEEVKGGAIQSVVRMTVEIDGQEKPACVADTVSRYFP